MFRHRMFIRFIVPLFSAFLLATSLIGLHLTLGKTPLAYASNNGLASTPLLGWSSWSLTGANNVSHGKSWMTSANIEAQSDAMHQKLQAYGYNYINLDAYWYQQSGSDFTVDAYGRWTPDTTRFPDIGALSTYIHNNGQKFGLYLVPGIPKLAVSQTTPILGTSCHANDITVQPLTAGNHFGNTYKIDYTKTCAQSYINSIAAQLQGWGVDFLKLDAVAPGSGVAGYDTRADVQAYAQALNPDHIWLELSSSVDINSISTWQQYSNGWRISGDIECYSSCSGNLTNWSKVSGRFSQAPKWATFAGPGGWNDFDSLDVGNGTMDGLSTDERQSYMTLWAISAVPLYTGDDLTTIDSDGLSLLTNSEVIAVDQAGKVATPVSQSTNQQVWRVHNSDGSVTVALFNLDAASASVTANWSDLGLSGSASVRDLWSHSVLGTFSGSFSATLPAHGSRLLRISSSTTTSYEAESTTNTLTGTAAVATCSACSGGHRVRYVGKGATLQFNNINVATAGTYTITIYYIDGDAGRSGYVSANGGSATLINFHGTNDSNWNVVQSTTVTLTLNAGNNTILLSNPSAWAPDFDRIVG